MSINVGTLYIVSTPIGNLGDMTARALQILADVDQIAAEDTRHTRSLLQHFAISTPAFSLHEHNEEAKCTNVVEKLKAGLDIALVSDAGTPLISDPGYMLVRLCHEQGVEVVPVPGVSALIAALSVSGLATDRFLFEGFLPRTSAKRITKFEALKTFPSTLVFYESSHRIVDTLIDMLTVFGAERRVVIARELTKQFETILNQPLGELLETVSNDTNQQRGEFVIIVDGSHEIQQQGQIELERILDALSVELPPNKAAKVAAQITGMPKRQLYDMLVQHK